MATVRFPYGRMQLTGEFPDDRFQGVLTSSLEAYVPEDTEADLVRKALASPVGSPRLSELSKGKRKIVVISSDHTRPVPSKIIMPEILKEIRRGNPDADVTILIATGCHRGTTSAELEEKFGSEIYHNEKIYVHDCEDASMLVDIGELPSGGRLVINRIAAEADLLIGEGFIEPHFFAGFSGGRKSVLPGVASRPTVMYNHNAGFIASPYARTGSIDQNPIHIDMLSAAKQAHLQFICNVVINSEKKIIHAVAGGLEEAHLEGRTFLSRFCKVKAVPSDIVVTTNGGYPLDQNVYQAVKGMTAAEATVREGGVIVMLAASSDGHGGESFYRTFRDEKDLRALTARFLATPPEKTVADQWEAQIFARILMKATVIYVSEMPDGMVRDLHMVPAHSIEEALKLADETLRKKGIERGSILAIPDGVAVIVEE